MMQPPIAHVWYRWGPGNRLFDSPGRLSVPFAETKGTRNCTIQYGNGCFSMQRGIVTRWLPQSLRDSSLPEGAVAKRLREPADY